MKHKLLLARPASVVIVVALLGAACAPIPLYPPRAVTPTTSVFLPGVQAPAPGTSPLQPTAVVTGTVPTSPTAGPTSTVIIPTATPLPTLAGPVWQWVSSTFKDGTVLAPSDPTRYTFQLVGDGNGLVQADCNFGSITYQESDGNLSFSAIGTTKMACPPDSQDSAFLAQLRNSTSYAIESGELVITLKDQAGTMRLRAAPGEASAESAPAPESSASPTPLPTDTPWPATATPQEPTVAPKTIAPPTPTSIPPATPTSVPLAPVTSVPLASPTQVLLGTPLPVSTGVAPVQVMPDINGTSWLLVSLTANDQAIPPFGTTPVSLEVDPDGTRISGSTGCNLYRATLRRDGSGASIVAPALMTQKACAANLMVQEVEFIDSLLRTRSYTARGNELTLLDAAGSELMVFTRR
jgi:heat shock protein HslJ